MKKFIFVLVSFICLVGCDNPKIIPLEKPLEKPKMVTKYKIQILERTNLSVIKTFTVDDSWKYCLSNNGLVIEIQLSDDGTNVLICTPPFQITSFVEEVK